MAGTPQAIRAQQSAVVLMQAVRQEDGPTLYEVLRGAVHDDHPAEIMVALSALVPTALDIMEHRIADLLADSELLHAAGNAAALGTPLTPSALAISTEDILRAIGVASVLNAPG